MTDPRTSYQRGASYDDQHEADLTAAIVNAIAESSMLALGNGERVLVLRTGEIIAALITALTLALSMSPEAMRSPTVIRKHCDELEKRLRRRVATVRASAEIRAFHDRCFRDDDAERGGNA